MTTIHGVSIPDSRLARAATELVRDTETPLLFHHSSRVYYFGALAGLKRKLSFDRELLYVGAMFHDMGLMPQHSSADERFEVDGAMPRAISCAGTASPRRISTRSGRRSRYTPRRASPSTCTRSSHWSRPASRWTCSV